jgi:hypothetical protein
MKYIFLALILLSCKKEAIQENKPTECNCYEYHEKRNIQLDKWEFDYSTVGQPDLCSKQTGVWIYDSKVVNRYKVNCN